MSNNVRLTNLRILENYERKRISQNWEEIQTGAQSPVPKLITGNSGQNLYKSRPQSFLVLFFGHLVVLSLLGAYKVYYDGRKKGYMNQFSVTLLLPNIYLEF